VAGNLIYDIEVGAHIVGTHIVGTSSQNVFTFRLLEFRFLCSVPAAETVFKTCHRKKSWDKQMAAIAVAAHLTNGGRAL
jgi:hypothetical protein